MNPSSKKESKPKIPRGKSAAVAPVRPNQATGAEFEREGLGVAPKE
jgi:hypothetical protein